jgi:hypothetical protein
MALGTLWLVVADAGLLELIQAIARRDVTAALTMLDAQPSLALASVSVGATRENPGDWFFEAIAHYAYAGDTALHVAAAAYDVVVVQRLIELGADGAAANRRGATPLHYACDGVTAAAAFDGAQHDVVALLIAAGADPNVRDKSGVAPLHRAVRTRCAAAVRALLAGGAGASLPNKSGSTPLDLARRTTGRGGSGSPAARAEQQAIIEMLTKATA